ncbi:TonB-dependent receptor [Mucilaginibacter conchicola]|uniref:TonB-dependent receptor n=1 Tax=Mucilaginibacter conchicola TaxID=2303333 RepID=A0A372NZR5_9SPHI|nr:TonB-dependent receptor [Mucilaginibacter conchicola]RFZ95615.1 TonB-dependent receptor [Mucilaginibacter conchicola]
MRLTFTFSCVLFIAAGLYNADVFAQAPAPTDTSKTRFLPEVTISVKPNVRGNDTRKLSRKDLELVQSNTLGETLSHISGVQNGYFGPNSGMPVIRSLSGNRVRVLANGLGVNDLSGISPNLNVIADMDNLLGMDVYKGSASVLFGGKAIGGAVNMRDNTIPLSRPDKPLSGFITGEAGTNYGIKQAFDLNGNVGTNWVWHAGAMNRFNNDLKIPGNTKAPIAYDPKIDNLTESMAQVNVQKEIIRNLSLYPYISQFVLNNLNNPAWDLSEDDLYTFQPNSVIGGKEVPNPANSKYIPGQDPNTPLSTTVVKGITDYAPVKKGIMPNSRSESRTINLGTSYLGNNFYTGVGFRGAYGYYGIPGFALPKVPGQDSHHGPVGTDYRPINTQSVSNSLLSETGYRPVSDFISILRLNYMLQASDDRELIGDQLANRFNTTRHVARFEAVQQDWKFLSGTSGVDYSYMNMKGAGDQRYLPNNLSRELGLFTLQRVNFEPVQVTLGYRHDEVARRAMPDPTYKPGRGLAGGKLSPRDFSLNQYNADAQWSILKIGYIKAGYSHSERAPDVNELYAGNDHFAIMLEENGDDRLKKEIAKAIDLGAGMDYHGWHVAASRYQTRFNNYMYLAHTGIARSGGFLVKEWRQSDTKITGWEAELGYRSPANKILKWELASYFDLVKNINTSKDKLRQWAEGDYMPNMPTSRYGFNGGAGYKKISLNLFFDRYLRQRYLGKNINPEPAMPPYSMLSGRISYTGKLSGLDMEYYLSGNNLLNVEARPQNSFLKYLAPLPGRNISLGIKARI